MHVIKSGPDLDVLEEGHSEDGKDEHDEEQEEADVDEGGKRHHEGKEQRPDALRALDETQDTTDFCHSDDSEQRRRHEVLLDKVT